MRIGTHGFVVGMRDVDRRAVADLLAARLRRIGVEHGREEDRAPIGVEVEDLGRIGREAESVFRRPLADLGRAALEDRDVQGVDADLHDHLGAGSCAQRSVEEHGLRVRLADEPLEGPVAALLDARRNPGQRGERAERATAARELE